MTHESIAVISNLTGIGRETVSKKLRSLPYEEGARGAKLYNTVDALPKLYISDSPDTIDLTQARAVLATKQSAKIDLDMELRRGDYAIKADIRDGIIAVFTAFRSKMLGLPTKAVPQLVVAKNAVEQEQILLELVHDALKELKTPDVLNAGSDGPDLQPVRPRTRPPTKANRK